MANDFLTLIKTRRSIRAYKPDAVPADLSLIHISEPTRRS